MDSDEEEGGAGSIGALTAMAKAFGFNLPQMASQRDDLVLKLQDAQNAAERAQLQSQLDQIQRNFEDLVEKMGGSETPVQAAINKATEQIVLEKFMGGSNTSLEGKLMDRMLARFDRELDAQDNPQGVKGVLGNALDTIREFHEMADLMRPAAAPSSHMTPEAVLELEVQKLTMEKEIAFHRIDKEVELQAAKTEAFTTVAKYIGNGLEFVGKSLAKEIIDSTSDEVPASFNVQTEKSQTDNAGDWVECPDCKQNGLFVTIGMRQRITNGETVFVTCTNCGTEHTTTGPAAAGQTADPNAPSPSSAAEASAPRAPASRYRLTESGKEVPRFAVGVS